MALISCPECTKEISDKVSSCPHCGYPMIEEKSDIQKVEVASVSLKIEERKKKKIIKTAIIFIVIISIVSGIAWSYNNQKTQEAMATYSENINSITLEMMTGGILSEGLMNLTSKVWYNAIYEERDSQTDKYTRTGNFWVSDFNEALGKLFADKDVETIVKSIEDSQINVSVLMKSLNDPPETYGKSHEILLELYSAYKGLTDLAMNPKGSLTTFSSNRNEKIDQFTALYDKLMNQLP